MTVDSAASDADLIARYRGGESAAAGDLFERHHGAAVRLASAMAGPSRADDIASDAFTGVLQALRNGNGPDFAFRPYLLTAVRNAVYTVHKRDGRHVWTDDVEATVGTPAEDPVDLRQESSLLAQAFEALPERWQAVLWHTAIQGDSNDDVAEALGIKPGAVAALAYRAREGLRRSYLAAHVPPSGAADCRAIRDDLALFSRGALSPSAQVRVQAHLDQCVDCSSVADDLQGISRHLALLLIPALLGPAAAGLLNETPDATPAQTGAPATPGSVPPGPAPSVAGRAAWLSQPGLVGGIATGVAVVVLATAGIVYGVTRGSAPTTAPLVGPLGADLTIPLLPTPPKREPIEPDEVTDTSLVPAAVAATMPTSLPDEPQSPEPAPPVAPEPEPTTTYTDDLSVSIVDTDGILATSAVFTLAIIAPNATPTVTVTAPTLGPGAWNFEPRGDDSWTCQPLSDTSFSCTATGPNPPDPEVYLDYEDGNPQFTIEISADDNTDPDSTNNSVSYP